MNFSHTNCVHLFHGKNCFRRSERNASSLCMNSNSTEVVVFVFGYFSQFAQWIYVGLRMYWCFLAALRCSVRTMCWEMARLHGNIWILCWTFVGEIDCNLLKLLNKNLNLNPALTNRLLWSFTHIQFSLSVWTRSRVRRVVNGLVTFRSLLCCVLDICVVNLIDLTFLEAFVRFHNWIKTFKIDFFELHVDTFTANEHLNLTSLCWGLVIGA